MSTKYIFITGGVVSGLGKGITSASLGRLLKSRGLNVTAQKLDPYLNVDPGTMNPVQHGEVFVTDDGAETDLDLGHYERFIDVSLSQNSNLTSGRVYYKVISDERKGVYGGQTVQIIPHVTNEIKNYIRKNSEGYDVCLVETGGTVGDIESQPFLEAIRQFSLEAGRENCCFVHVTLVPYLHASDELKSKPTQHSVKELLSIGIQPDIIVCRTEKPLTDEIKRKISLFCNVEKDCVIENANCDILYAVPMMLKKQNMDDVVMRKLSIYAPNQDLSDWENMLFALRNPGQTVKIALVGKYVELHDSYISVNEALKHGGIATRSAVEIDWIDSEKLEGDGVSPGDLLADADGILVPGGFGTRGIEGKIRACRYARENKVPFLGICLGMQTAIIEFARNVLGLENANSAEIDPDTPYPVIDLLPEQKKVTDMGGTMRLGQYPCKLDPASKAYSLYRAECISERHRHRYEVNNDYRERLEAGGMLLAGTSPDGRIVEMIELPDHPFFVAGQFHPEFKSRPNRPHPLFEGFVTAAYQKKRSK